MAAGLKERWKLRPARNGNLDTGAQRFEAAFQDQLKVIDAGLQYTAVHADSWWQGQQVSARAQLIADYQTALGKIASSGAAGKGAADQVLASAKALAREISRMKWRVEGSADDWMRESLTYELKSREFSYACY